MYLSPHCCHLNDSCVKMGSDESHFNVSVGSDGQSHKTVSTNHHLFEERGEPRAESNRGPCAYRPNALPLGQNRLTNNTARRPGRCCYSASPSLLAVYTYWQAVRTYHSLRASPYSGLTIESGPRVSLLHTTTVFSLELGHVSKSILAVF